MLDAVPNRVVVTGGAGFIGSHSVEALVAGGVSVLVVDDMSHPCGHPPPPGVELVEADCGSVEAARAVAAFEPTALLHLAARGGVNRSLRDPAGHVGSVLASTVAVYAAACDVGATRIVTASSGGTYYGDAEVLPTPEGAPPTPRSPYGAEKVSEEVYLAMFGRLHGISTMALRYGNVYGPRQDGTGEAGVVAITCRRLAAGQRPVMYGDGGQSRDFVYVGDVVAANVAALASDRSGAVNVGTGDDETILGVMRVLCELHGASPDMEKAPARVGEVRRICLDPRRATEWLEWRPATSRQDGLASTVRYFSGTG